MTPPEINAFLVAHFNGAGEKELAPLREAALAHTRLLLDTPCREMLKGPSGEPQLSEEGKAAYMKILGRVMGGTKDDYKKPSGLSAPEKEVYNG